MGKHACQKENGIQVEVRVQGSTCGLRLPLEASLSPYSSYFRMTSRAAWHVAVDMVRVQNSQETLPAHVYIMPRNMLQYASRNIHAALPDRLFKAQSPNTSVPTCYQRPPS